MLSFKHYVSVLFRHVYEYLNMHTQPKAITFKTIKEKINYGFFFSYEGFQP